MKWTWAHNRQMVPERRLKTFTQNVLVNVSTFSGYPKSGEMSRRLEFLEFCPPSRSLAMKSENQIQTSHESKSSRILPCTIFTYFSFLNKNTNFWHDSRLACVKLQLVSVKH